ncbi:MAG: TRAP transporter permease [Methyloligellaceae bacterium]
MNAQTFERQVVRVIAVGMSTFHLYTAYAGTFYPYIQRSVPLLLSVVLAFLTLTPAGKRRDDQRIPFFDWLLVLAAIFAFGFVALESDYLSRRWPMTPTFAPSTKEIGLAILAALLVLEAARRTMGWVLVIVAVCGLLYAYLGEFVPWKTVSHRGFTFVQVIDHMYLTLEGMWGVALGVAATYITLFVIFGAFAEKAGATDFFVRLATAISGHTSGGPAKVAIFSSGFIGSVTGSTVANVYTTGQFTIPMMKRLGYRPSIAGAVEALASNGGQIMPPVLGAAAFLISAYAAVPYYKVALASLIPALLYFGMLYWFIHLEALKTGLKGIPRHEKPSVLRVLLEGGHLISPLLVLVGLLVYGYSPIRAAFYSILFTVAISWLRPETRIGPKKLVEALEAGARNSVMIVIICAVVGFVIGAFTLTGLGLNISSAIINLAGGNFAFILILVGLACILMGTGMNTVAAYILVSVIAVPALTAKGVDALSANMFVFYFALLSHITPPVCLAIFAAASVADANPWETAYQGMKMGVVAYLLPFLIIISPGLVLIGSSANIAVQLLATATGCLLIVSAIQGWLLNPMHVVVRLLAAAAGALLLWHTVETRVAGAILAGALIGYEVIANRKSVAKADSAAE